MDEQKLMKELRQIRNLLILLAIKSGATTTDVGDITGMGRTNVSGLCSQRGGQKKDKASRRKT